MTTWPASASHAHVFTVAKSYSGSGSARILILAASATSTRQAQRPAASAIVRVCEWSVIGSSSGFAHLQGTLRRRRGEEMHQARNDAGPYGLVRGAGHLPLCSCIV